MESTRPGARTVRFDNVAVFPREDGSYALVFRDLGGNEIITTVNDRPGSARQHGHLFRKLTEVFERNGIDVEPPDSDDR
jgi:hypothetical protein